jgi:hypothetical protein
MKKVECLVRLCGYEDPLSRYDTGLACAGRNHESCGEFLACEV